MADKLIVALRKKLEEERRRYTALVNAYAKELETSEQLRDQLAVALGVGRQHGS